MPWVIGRYELHGQIASGGMASVHIGRLVGPGGFGRTVAIKRLHAQFATDPEFVAMFLDEARLAARVQHPNVVPTIDIMATEGELFLVMEHVQGEALSKLIRAALRVKEPIPLPVISTILTGALLGLHAAHETRDERGHLLGIVHRDVSPQNVLVGVDGVPRVLDFGVAKAGGRVQTTREGQLKGKLAYMAPEQLKRAELDRTADLYAAGVVLWEALTLERLFTGDSEAQIVGKILEGNVPPPSRTDSRIPAEMDAVVCRALHADPKQRFATAKEMAAAVEQAVRPATATEVGNWVASVAAEPLQKRKEQIAEIESKSEVNSGVGSQAKLFLHELASGPSSLRSESTVGMATPSSGSLEGTRARSKRATLVGVGGFAGGLVVLGLVISAISASRSGGETASAAPTPSSTQSPTPSTLAPAPPPKVEALAPASSESARPSATVAAPTSAPPPPPKRWTPPTRPAAALAPAPAPKAGKDCDPPYTIDSAGEKHYKRECF